MINISKTLNKRVADVAELEQTPELKTDLYKMVAAMVRKYQPMYYYQYKGELSDLASDAFTSFLTRKGRGTLKESLLDKWDPAKASLQGLVSISVKRFLIDRSRTDKGEVNYSENFDDGDDAKRLTTDLLSFNLSNEDEEDISQITFSEEFIEEMVKRFKELPPRNRASFVKALKHYRKEYGLYDNFEALFSHLKEYIDNPSLIGDSGHWITLPYHKSYFDILLNHSIRK